MAYKNKKKNKAHIKQLQKKGWRASDKVMRKKAAFMDRMKRIGMSTAQAEKLYNQQIK